MFYFLVFNFLPNRLQAMDHGVLVEGRLRQHHLEPCHLLLAAAVASCRHACCIHQENQHQNPVQTTQTNNSLLR
uniref:Uncharacterized protein n=1 Tax=Arundo donax TaxID=35708 RepID=A0A0A9DLN8_ARUDO